MAYQELGYETEGLVAVPRISWYAGQADKIWSLKIEQSEWEQVKAVLGEMANLQQVVVAECEDLVLLMDMLARLPRLVDLEFRLPKGAAIPPSLGRMRTLRKLGLRGLCSPALPEWLQDLEHLQVVDLDVVEWLGAEEQLAVLGKMPRLESLVITQRSNAPKGLGYMQQLKQLKATRLDRTPEGLDRLVVLEDLHLEYLENATCKVTELSHLSSLKRLRIRTDASMVLPESVDALQQLESLNLSNCGLRTLPDAWSGLASLKSLELQHNRLKKIPDWIGELQNLREIDLSKNQLSSLPLSIARLQHLQKVTLDGNAIKTYPKCLAQSTSLLEVSLAGNDLDRFPFSKLRCTDLTRMDLSSNALTAFPAALLALPRVEILVGGNPFSRQGGYKLEEVVQSVSSRHRDYAGRPTLLALALGDLDLALKTATFDHLLLALQDENEKLRGFALAAMSRMLPDPFASGTLPTRVALLGQAKGYPVAGFSEKLAKAGIELVQAKAGGADLLVIGERPGFSLAHHHRSGMRLATLPQLAAFVESLSPRWLQDHTWQNPQVGQNFQMLWESDSPDNVKLALEMAVSGGLPDAVTLPEVLAMSLFSPDAGIRKLAANFFQAGASPELRAYARANARDLSSIGTEDLQRYVFDFLRFLGENGRGFAKTAFRFKPELKICFLHYMTGEELKRHWTSDGCLTIPWTPLRTLPKGILEIKSLKRLSLRGLSLGLRPAGLGAIRGLEWLNLAHNALSDLPSDFGDLTQLTYLDLSDNRLSEVPTQLRGLRHLAQLNLSRNPFRGLPDWMDRMEALEELTLWGSQLDAFPEVLRHIPKLSRLALEVVGDSAKVESVIAPVMQLQGLKMLRLNGFSSESLPQAIDLPLLEHLDLPHSGRLATLPDSLCSCTSLKTIDLQYCERFTTLPAAIGRLVHLEELDLKKTRVTQLPASFAKLVGLRKLVLPSAKFKDKAGTLAILEALPNLEVIDCHWHYDFKFIDALRDRFSDRVLGG